MVCFFIVRLGLHFPLVHTRPTPRHAKLRFGRFPSGQLQDAARAPPQEIYRTRCPTRGDAFAQALAVADMDD